MEIHKLNRQAHRLHNSKFHNVPQTQISSQRILEPAFENQWSHRTRLINERLAFCANDGCFKQHNQFPQPGLTLWSWWQRQVWARLAHSSFRLCEPCDSGGFHACTSACTPYGTSQPFCKSASWSPFVPTWQVKVKKKNAREKRIEN